ncbi:MAG: hypothetical protein RIR18_418 [Pseudomonadota bacterium]|jgi:hypothetical protein
MKPSDLLLVISCVFLSGALSDIANYILALIAFGLTFWQMRAEKGGA